MPDQFVILLVSARVAPLCTSIIPELLLAPDNADLTLNVPPDTLTVERSPEKFNPAKTELAAKEKTTNNDRLRLHIIPSFYKNKILPSS